MTGPGDRSTVFFPPDLPTGTLWLLSRGRYHLGVAGKFTVAQAATILADLDRRTRDLLH